MVDRIGPTRRPNEKVRGYQSWQSLLFMHWPVPVDEIRQLVPTSMELDLFDGVAYIGLVPFAMAGVRPNWAPSTLAFNFLETNVRTYVTVNGKPGVVFLSLEAASRLAVWVAKKFWGLPYYYAQMSIAKQGDQVEYESRREGADAQLNVQYKIGDPLDTSDLESLEFFFLERYLLFVERHGKTLSGQVHHTPYPAHRAEVLEIDNSLLSSLGLSCDSLPTFAHYSPGVDVEIFDLKNA